MHRRALAAIMSTIAFATPATAWAQADAARALVLFEQAVTAMKNGDYAAACPRFAASQQIDPKTSTLLNLASCYELNGQTASAWAAFKEAEAAALKFGRKDWAERAATATKRLEPKLVRLVVHVPVKVRAVQPTIELDGVTLRPTEWDEVFPVDPGPHRLTWSATGFTSATQTIDITTTNAELTLTELERVPAAPVSASPDRVTPATTAPASMWTTGRVAGVVLAGAGVGSVVAGSVFGLAASARHSDAEDLCGVSTGSPRVCLPASSPQALEARDGAATRATLSTAFFIAGGVLAAGGVALIVLSPPRTDRKVAIVPWPGGLFAAGHW